MAIDRAGARRRVRTITGWAAGGAAALTAVFAFGAARGSHVAKATTRSGSGSAGSGRQDALPQQSDPQLTIPQDPQTPYSQGQGASPQDPQGGQGFSPPSSSTAPPAAMSGGS
jgi:outer membrane lipoprotein SlyB